MAILHKAWAGVNWEDGGMINNNFTYKLRGMNTECMKALNHYKPAIFFFFLYKNLFFDDTIHIMYKMISSIQAIFKLDQSVQSLILMLVHVPLQLLQVWHAKHWLINVSYISHNIKYILYYLWFTAVEEIIYLDLHKSLGVCNIRMDIIKYVGIYSNISCSIQ